LREYGKKYRLKFAAADLEKRLKTIHYDELETFLQDVGSGKKTLDRQALKSLFPEVNAVEIKPAKKPASSRKAGLYKLINVDGQADIDFIFAKCCHPIKGEEIIGYITKNRGLVIHKKNCPNVNLEIPSRLKQVSWNEVPKHAYQVKLQLLVADKPGMLSTITGITAASDSNIKKIELEQTSQAMARISIVFDVRDMFQLNEIISRFKVLPGVYSLNRKKLAEK